MNMNALTTTMANMMMNHSMMNHSAMDHSAMNHSSMDHSSMDHSGMDHSGMDHSGMDHSGMDHSGMDHSGMDHSGMDHSGMMGMDMNHSMPGMQMFFHIGNTEYVLFKECLTESDGGIIAACFIIFFVAILYEGLKFVREVLLQSSLRSRGPQTYVESKLPAGSSQEQMVMQMENQSISSRMLTCSHLLQTILHIIQVFISYCLMLVFMTYNVWLCLAVVLGAGVGYFLFGWKRAVVVDSNEHCH